MPALPDKNHSIQCRCCGFLYKIQHPHRSTPIFCPSCGDEYVHDVVHDAVHDASVDTLLADTFSERNSSERNTRIRETETDENRRPFSDDRMGRRWGILFFAVCLQWAILLFTPIFVYNSIKYNSIKYDSIKYDSIRLDESSEQKSEAVRSATPNPTDLSKNGSTSNRIDSTESSFLTRLSSAPVSVPAQSHAPTAQKTELALDPEPADKISPNDFNSAQIGTPGMPVDPFLAMPSTLPPTTSSSVSASATPTKTLDSLSGIKVPLNASFSYDSLTKPQEENPASGTESLDAGKLNSEKLNTLEDASSATVSTEVPAATSTSSATTQYEAQLAKAKLRLDEARSLIALDPERALLESLQAVGMFRKLGQSIPSTAYWIISQAYASQSWGEALIEESSPIENMAVSSDSRWLLTQCSDNTVWIWDIFRTQKTTEGFKLDSGESPFVKLLFTPDFRLAIGGESDGTIRIWDTSLKKPADSVVTLGGVCRGLCDLQVSPDGRWLAAYGDGTAPRSMARNPVRYRAQNPAQSQTQHHEAARQESRLVPKSSPNPEKILQCRSNGQSNQPGEIVLVSYDKPETAGKTLPTATPEDANVVWLWDLEQLKKGIVPQPIALRGHEKPIYVMTISSDSRWLVTGSEDTTARIYDLKGAFPGADQAVLKGHELGVTAVAIASNGKWVATGSRDNTVRLWSLPDSHSPTAGKILTGHIGWVSALATDEKGDRLISGSYDKTIRIWNVPNADISKASESDCVVLSNEQGTVLQLLLSQDGKTLVSLGGDASLRIRELSRRFGQEAEPQRSVTIRNRMLPITRVAMTPDNHWVVFNYVNQREPSNSGVRLWPIRLEKLIESASASGR